MRRGRGFQEEREAAPLCLPRLPARLVLIGAADGRKPQGSPRRGASLRTGFSRHRPRGPVLRDRVGLQARHQRGRHHHELGADDA